MQVPAIDRRQEGAKRKKPRHDEGADDGKQRGVLDLSLAGVVRAVDDRRDNACNLAHDSVYDPKDA
jgi:hypothetical protein